MRVLHEVGQRQVEQLGCAPPQQLQPRVQHVDRQVRRILVGLAAADHALDVRDAVVGQRHPVGLLGREGDAVEPARQHQAQLVLGRHRRRLHAGLGHAGEDGAAAHQRRVRDHALLARGAVEIVVAGDTVHGRRHAGDDRSVVGIGEGRHGSLGRAEEARLAKSGDGGQNAVPDAALDVGRIAPVEADHHRRPLGRLIAAPVHVYCCHVTPYPRPGTAPASRGILIKFSHTRTRVV